MVLPPMRYNDNFGAMWVRATDTTITFQFYAITNDGELIDAYTLSASS